jgi:putative membrane protein
MSLATHSHEQYEIGSLLISVVVLLLGLFYVRGWLVTRGASKIFLSVWRLAAFLTGLVSLWVALASPLASLDHLFLTAHMLKHLLLMTVSAPLVLLGEPSSLVLLGLPKCFVDRGSLLSRHGPLVGYVLDNSIFAWIAGTVTVIAWHVPSLFALARTSQTWHALEYLSFLCAGLLFWRPVVSHGLSDAKRPQWSIPMYLFFAMLPCDALAAFLVFCGHIVYPSSRLTIQSSSLLPLQDQEYAGAIMWVWVTFAYLIPAILITMRILDPSGVRHRNEHS